MTTIKIGAVKYRSKTAAIKNLIKRSKKSPSEIAKAVGSSVALVSIIAKQMGIKVKKNQRIQTRA